MYAVYYYLTEYLWVFGVLLFIYLAYRGITARDEEQALAKKKWQDAVDKKLNEPMTLHPEIDPNLCGGCGACVTACPEGKILQLINHKAKLVEPTKCVGHGACEVACPLDAIKLVFGTKTRGMQLPRVNPNYETNISGLYIAGELGGMGLIRNAVKQGKLAAEHAVSKVSSSPGKAQYDVLVVGAGPAGLAASLACSAQKSNYICLEQSNFGGTIFNFPKQKVVMSHPMDFPMAGKIQFPKNKVSKEEILEVWGGLRKQYQLKISEQVKFINLSKKEGVFQVETNQGILTSKKVIMAMGVRGSPRKLGLPGEESTKVTYNLLDPEQYKDCDIAVVGGGNAAVEAAQYLAKTRLDNRVYLLVRGAEFDRCNEENQRIIYQMQKDQRVFISFKTVVKEIHKNYLIVDKDGQSLRLANNYLFIFAGAELPFKFLESLGVKIDTKFGEALG